MPRIIALVLQYYNVVYQVNSLRQITFTCKLGNRPHKSYN